MIKKFGFTLIEMLMVVGIVVVLTTIVFVTIDPQKRIKSSRDSKRMADVDTILIAVHQYINDSGGTLPTGVGNSIYQIGTCTTGGMNLCIGATTQCVNLGVALSSNRYIKSNPIDPQRGTAATTGYSITKDSENRYTVKACLGEGTTISATR